MLRRSLPLFAGLLAFLILTAIAQVVYADAGVPADENAVTRLADMAFEILTPVLSVVVIWLVHRAIAAFEARTGIDVPAQQEALIDAWVEQGIAFAEEKSRNKVKEKTSKLTGPAKLEEAADFVFDLARARGWIDWSRDRVKRKIEGKLGIARAAGAKPSLDKPTVNPAPLQSP